MRASTRTVFRLAIPALLLLLSGQIAYGWFRSRWNAVTPAATGDSLVIAETTFLGRETEISAFSSSYPGRCIAVIFYRSTCPACERVAPSYRGVDAISLNGEKVPLAWVAARPDRGRFAFAEEHGVENVVTTSRRAFHDMGVDKVPLLYVLSPDRVILAISHPRREVVAELAQSHPAIGRACGIDDTSARRTKVETPIVQ